jgi:TRAP-type C4-dicarboxylate transport system permease small subunit
MLRAIGFLVSMVFFLTIYGFVLAPALEKVSSSVQAASAPGIPFGIFNTVLFVGMPLVLLGGVILVVFVIATGIRGTSL